MDDSGVVEAVAGLQQLIEADGGAFELIGMDRGVLRLKLLLDNVECEECILPPDALAQVANDFVRRTAPEVARVELDDPRPAVAP
jgi:hypothetical protein